MTAMEAAKLAMGVPTADQLASRAKNFGAAASLAKLNTIGATARSSLEGFGRAIDTLGAFRSAAETLGRRHEERRLAIEKMIAPLLDRMKIR